MPSDIKHLSPEEKQRAHDEGEKWSKREREGSNSLIESTLPSERSSFWNFDDRRTGGSADERREAFDAGADNDKKQSSGCFLTTACVEHSGLRDDCHELMVLRSFRDHYVAEQLDGAEMLTEYYLVAPAIVHCIYQSINRDAELAKIFKVIAEAVRLIEQGNNEEALTLYQGLFKELKHRYSRVSPRE